MRNLRSCALLVVLIVAWNANVEALPVHHSEHANLGDAAEVAQVPQPIPKVGPPIAPQSAAIARADADAEAAQLKVDQARAAVDGPPVEQEPVPRSPALPKADSPPGDDPNGVENAKPVTVGAPEVDPNSLELNPEETYVKPPQPEFINRFLNPGDRGFVAQQTERPIHTADHEIHNINIKLQQQRDHKYYVARGSKDVLMAAEKGSHATAEMANAVREQEEQDVALSEAKVRNIKAEILEHQGTNNKEHAKLQLKLVHEEQKHTKLLATAKTMGQAVNTAIDKAGDIEGRARAQYHQDMDPQMELSEAIVDAARAKMALEEHDKQVEQENQQARADKKNREYFKKVQRDGEQAMAAIREQGDAYRSKQEDKDYKEDIKASDAAQKESMRVGTVRAETVQIVPPQQPQQEYSNPGDRTPPQGYNGQGQQYPPQPQQQYPPGQEPGSEDDLAAKAKAATDYARANPNAESAAAAEAAVRAFKSAPAQTADQKIENTVAREVKESNAIAQGAMNPSDAGFRL